MIKSLIFAVLQKPTEPHLYFDNRALAESIPWHTLQARKTKANKNFNAGHDAWKLLISPGHYGWM